jgi:hypothetical protein
VRYKEQLITFGGNNTHVFLLDKLTIFNLKSNEFELLQTKPDPVHGFPPVLCNPTSVHRGNMVYLLGGRALETVRASNVSDLLI